MFDINYIKEMLWNRILLYEDVRVNDYIIVSFKLMIILIGGV